MKLNMKGFTLTEFLVVITVIGLFLGILFPVLNHARALIGVRVMFEGEHLLRPVAGSTESDSSFFLVVGDTNSLVDGTAQMKFSWQMKDETWILSSLPIMKIRVKISNDITTPTVQFVLSRSQSTGEQPQQFIDSCVDYALFTVGENNWPFHLKLPAER
jgi:prepilin-type N-terminal cleavage/methylation domain-containing protein